MAHARAVRRRRWREEEVSRLRAGRSIQLGPSSDEDDDDGYGGEVAAAAVDLDGQIWSQLPDILQYRVLGWLPLQSLLRFRCVCKQWKSLFASPGFHHFPSRTNLSPWIFLFGSDGNVHGDGYGYGNVRNYGYGYVEDRLLSFDCGSASWLPSIPIPQGFFQDPFSRDSVCSVREKLLIAGTSSGCLYVCNLNPITPSRKELPPFVSIQREPAALGFAEDASPNFNPNLGPRSITLSTLKQMSIRNLQSCAQDKGDNIQVLAVGASHNGTLVVEIFYSSTGSWEVCGYLPSYLGFSQTRMVECNGSFYALLYQPRGMLIIRSIRRGHYMEWMREETPQPTNRDGDLGDPPPELLDAGLVACRNSVFMIGATTISLYGETQGGILIWRFHPHAQDAWQLHVAMPRAVYEDFYGDDPFVVLECRAHGDLIFFQHRGVRRILTYDVSQDSWRCLPKCEHSMESFAFMWEPRLIT